MCKRCRKIVILANRIIAALHMPLLVRQVYATSTPHHSHSKAKREKIAASTKTRDAFVCCLCAVMFTNSSLALVCYIYDAMLWMVNILVQCILCAVHGKAFTVVLLRFWYTIALSYVRRKDERWQMKHAHMPTEMESVWIMQWHFRTTVLQHISRSSPCDNFSTFQEMWMINNICTFPLKYLTNYFWYSWSWAGGSNGKVRHLFISRTFSENAWFEDELEKSNTTEESKRTHRNHKMFSGDSL